jgi:outer membrane protein assembly factor BamB
MTLGRFFPLLLLSILACAADWPQWRGPNRDGISPETGLLDAWPAAGPRLVWKTQGLGEGYAAFSIVRSRLYTQGQRGDEEYVLALDANTGKKLWQTTTGKSFREQRGYGPRGTPSIDGDRLYALAADGTLVCLETAGGKRIWQVNIVEKFGGRVLHWGISESPLVDGDRLIVTPGGSGAAVAALDKRTGKVLWQSQSEKAGYSSPIAFDLGGVRRIAVFTGEGALGLNESNGELLWKYNKVSNRTANIATPIFQDGYLFLSSAYGTGCALLKLSGQGGGVQASEVYFSKEMRNHYCTSVLVNGYLYGYSDAILTAMNFRTGAVAWRNRAVGKGNLIYADRHLYCLSEDGVMGLVEAAPDAYKEKSRFQISRGEFPTWTPPVIADGRLYLREQDNLYCYDIRRPAKP